MTQTILTVDLEYDWESNGIKNLLLIPKILDFFKSNNIEATFFIVGSLVEKNEELIKEISKKHEIANHSFSHRFLDKLPKEELENEVVEPKRILQELKIKCDGFRAPYGAIPKDLFELLERHNYKYDSSVFNSLFLGRYAHFKRLGVHKRGKIIEIPTDRFFMMPFGLSYVRLLYPLSMHLVPKKPTSFYFHPHEFLEDAPGKEINFFVRKLNGINRGKKAWGIFEKLIRKLQDSEIEFISCRRFLDSQSFS